jgi:hypothetical protein
VSTAGNIDTKAYFRIGVFYSSTSPSNTSGEVTVEVGFRT